MADGLKKFEAEPRVQESWSHGYMKDFVKRVPAKTNWRIGSYLSAATARTKVDDVRELARQLVSPTLQS